MNVIRLVQSKFLHCSATYGICPTVANTTCVTCSEHNYEHDVLVFKPYVMDVFVI